MTNPGKDTERFVLEIVKSQFAIHGNQIQKGVYQYEIHIKKSTYNCHYNGSLDHYNAGRH